MQHDFPHLLCEGEMSLRKCQVILEIPHHPCEGAMFLQKGQIVLEIIFQIIFEMIFVKSAMLWNSCRAHMWQQRAHTENTQSRV